MCPHLQRFVILVAVLWLGSGLEHRAEAGTILQTPAGLNPGDQFRFVFVTDGIRDATSTNIADYDRFVNDQAGGATYNGVVVNWLAIGSTDSVDAIDHVGQANAPVFLSDGTPVSSSTTDSGLWSETIRNPINLDLAGNPVDPLFFVWTGTNPTGTGFGGPLGSARPLTGSTTDTLIAWVSSGNSPSGDLRHLYGISSVLTVPQAVPEPSTLAMLGTALSVGLAIGRARHPRNSRSENRKSFRPISRSMNRRMGVMPVRPAGKNPETAAESAGPVPAGRNPHASCEPDGREGALRQPYRCTDFRARRRHGSVEGTAEVIGSRHRWSRPLQEGGSTK
jgi:hypothetical protein